jgi:hypothetical protein
MAISKDRDHGCMCDDIVSFVNIIFVGTRVDATHLPITYITTQTTKYYNIAANALNLK